MEPLFKAPSVARTNVFVVRSTWIGLGLEPGRAMHSPVHRYAAQMQYARCGKVYIQAVIYVAHERAEHPLAARQLHGCVECHRTEGDQHVGHRQ